MVGSGCFANLRIRYKLFLAYSAVLLLAGAAGTLILDSYVRRSIGAHTEAELKRSTMLVINMVRTATAVSIKNYLRAAAENNREIVNYYYQEYVTGQMGYRVVAITSSKDALQVLDSRPAEFDLIITDYTMPYLTGTELAE